MPPMADQLAIEYWGARRHTAADLRGETTMKKTCALAALACAAAGAARAQPRISKGEVTDVTSGDVLPGVTVTIEGTTLSATTASDGTFSIPDAPSGTLTVQLRAPGYRGATVSVPEDQSDVRVGLSRELAEEIVVTGRASRTERRNLGVSIATLKSEDVTETPAQTIDTALQGKVTGANIQRNDGAPGGGVQVRLRGGHLRCEGQQRRGHHQHQARAGGASPRGRDAAVRRLRAFEGDRRPHLRIGERSDQSVLSPGQDHGAAKSHLRGQSDRLFRTRHGLQSRQGARRATRSRDRDDRQ